MNPFLITALALAWAVSFLTGGIVFFQPNNKRSGLATLLFLASGISGALLLVSCAEQWDHLPHYPK